MKIWRFVKIIVLCFLLTSSSTFAHPGSLDGNGGHYNRKTGEYHYHSGENKYGSSSGSTSTYDYDYDYTPVPATSSPPESTPDSTPAPVPSSKIIYVQKDEQKSTGWIWGIGITVAFLVVSCFGLSRHSKRRQLNNNLKIDIPVIEVDATVKAQVCIPVGYSIDSDNLPYKTNRQYGWGREFNAFVTQSGRHFHRSRCNLIKGKRKILIHRYNAIKHYVPCSHCNPTAYIDKWYLDYKKADKGGEKLNLNG